MLVKKYVDGVYWPSLRKCIALRRQLLKQNKLADYSQVVAVVAENEKTILKLVSEEILGHFDLRED